MHGTSRSKAVHAVLQERRALRGREGTQRQLECWWLAFFEEGASRGLDSTQDIFTLADNGIVVGPVVEGFRQVRRGTRADGQACRS